MHSEVMITGRDLHSIQALRAAADPLWDAQRRYETSLARDHHSWAMAHVRREAERAALINPPHLATAWADRNAWEARGRATAYGDLTSYGAVAQAKRETERIQSLLNTPGLASALNDIVEANKQLHSGRPQWLESRIALQAANFNGQSISELRAGADIVGQFLEQNRLLSATGYSDYARAFDQVGLVTGLIASSHGVTLSTYERAMALSRHDIPYFDNVGQYGRFLDTAGLHFPRRLILRPISGAERKAKLAAMLEANKQPRLVRQAMADIYRFERTLREVIHIAMSREYGDDWAHRQLPLCGCQKVLSHWDDTDSVETILDDADFMHYIWIIEYSDHFEKVFAAGFEEPQLAPQLLRKIRNLRQGPYHSRGFTQQDALDLRLAMNELITGLEELLDSHELIWSDRCTSVELVQFS